MVELSVFVEGSRVCCLADMKEKKSGKGGLELKTLLTASKHRLLRTNREDHHTRPSMIGTIIKTKVK